VSASASVSPSSSTSPSASASPTIAAPSDSYDVELLNQFGLDVLQTLGRNRDTAAAEETPIFYASTSVHPCIDEEDTLTARISGNVVVGATLTVIVYYALGV